MNKKMTDPGYQFLRFAMARQLYLSEAIGLDFTEEDIEQANRLIEEMIDDPDNLFSFDSLDFFKDREPDSGTEGELR